MKEKTIKEMYLQKNMNSILYKIWTKNHLLILLELNLVMFLLFRDKKIFKAKVIITITNKNLNKITTIITITIILIIIITTVTVEITLMGEEEIKSSKIKNFKVKHLISTINNKSQIISMVKITIMVIVTIIINIIINRIIILRSLSNNRKLK